MTREEAIKKLESLKISLPAAKDEISGIIKLIETPWISVEDDLPCNHEELIIDDELFDKHTKPVICKKSYGVSCVGIMIYNVDRNVWRWVSEKPTHWFSIPELPKE